LQTTHAISIDLVQEYIRTVTFRNEINFSRNTRTQPKIGSVSGLCEQLCNTVWISKLTELTADLEQWQQRRTELLKTQRMEKWNTVTLPVPEHGVF